MTSNQKMAFKSVRRWLPGVFISIVTLVAVFRLANWKDIRLDFALNNPIHVVIALVLTFVSLLVRALAWRVLLGNRAGVRQAFFIINEGYMLNNLFPLRAGELGRAVFMGQASGLGSFHVLSTIVIERAFDLAVAAGLLLITLPMALELDWAKPAAFLTLGLVILALFAMFLAARYRFWTQKKLQRLGQRLPVLQRFIIPRVISLLDGFGILTQPVQFLLGLFLVILTWVFWLGTYYVMLLTVAPQAPFWWAMFIDAVLAMGLAVPSAPAGVGVYEASMVAALSILKVPPGIGLGFAIFMHVFNFVVTGFFGLLGLIIERRSISLLFEQTQLQE